MSVEDKELWSTLTAAYLGQARSLIVFAAGVLPRGYELIPGQLLRVHSMVHSSQGRSRSKRSKSREKHNSGNVSVCWKENCYNALFLLVPMPIVFPPCANLFSGVYSCDVVCIRLSSCMFAN